MCRVTVLAVGMMVRAVAGAQQLQVFVVVAAAAAAAAAMFWRLRWMAAASRQLRSGKEGRSKRRDRLKKQLVKPISWGPGGQTFFLFPLDKNFLTRIFLLSFSGAVFSSFEMWWTCLTSTAAVASMLASLVSLRKNQECSLKTKWRGFVDGNIFLSSISRLPLLLFFSTSSSFLGAIHNSGEKRSSDRAFKRHTFCAH